MTAKYKKNLKSNYTLIYKLAQSKSDPSTWELNEDMVQYLVDREILIQTYLYSSINRTKRAEPDLTYPNRLIKHAINETIF